MQYRTTGAIHLRRIIGKKLLRQTNPPLFYFNSKSYLFVNTEAQRRPNTLTLAERHNTRPIIVGAIQELLNP